MDNKPVNDENTVEESLNEHIERIFTNASDPLKRVNDLLKAAYTKKSKSEVGMIVRHARINVNDLKIDDEEKKKKKRKKTLLKLCLKKATSICFKYWWTVT